MTKTASIQKEKDGTADHNVLPKYVVKEIVIKKKIPKQKLEKDT